MGTLSETIFVRFGNKEYFTSRANFSTLITQSIKKSLPEQFQLVGTLISQSTESCYALVARNNYVSLIRISAHTRKKSASTNNTKVFLTTNFKNFSELEESITTYFATSPTLIKLTLKDVLSICVLKRIFKTSDHLELNNFNSGFFNKSLHKLIHLEAVYLSEGVLTSSAWIQFLYGYRYKFFKNQESLAKEVRLEETLSIDELIEAIDDPYLKPLFNYTQAYKATAINAFSGTLIKSWLIPNSLRGKLKVGDSVKVETKLGFKTVTIHSLYIASPYEKSCLKSIVELLNDPPSFSPKESDSIQEINGRFNVISANLNGKEQCWAIPFKLRTKLSVGDIVRVKTANGLPNVRINSLSNIPEEQLESLQPVKRLVTNPFIKPSI